MKNSDDKFVKIEASVDLLSSNVSAETHDKPATVAPAAVTTAPSPTKPDFAAIIRRAIGIVIGCAILVAMIIASDDPNCPGGDPTECMPGTAVVDHRQGARFGGD